MNSIIENIKKVFSDNEIGYNNISDFQRRNALVNFVKDTETYIKRNCHNAVNENLKALIKFFTIGIQSDINIYCFADDKPGVILKDLQPIILASLYPDVNNHWELVKCNINVDIVSDPVITNIWNRERQFDNFYNKIGKINENPFDGYKNNHKTNIWAYKYLPIGLVFVYNGNHSVNSAIIHNEGSFLCENCIDVSPLFHEYSFDGIDYLYNNKKITNEYLHSGSKPFNDKFGYLFELGKLLHKYNITF